MTAPRGREEAFLLSEPWMREIFRSHYEDSSLSPFWEIRR
jgi:hypothetical protein